MRKLFALFVLVMACFLVACSVSFNDLESKNPQEKEIVEVEKPEKKEVKADTAEKEEGEDEDKRENVDEKIVLDPEPVFIKSWAYECLIDSPVRIRKCYPFYLG